MRNPAEYMMDFSNLRKNGCFAGLKLNNAEPVFDGFLCRAFTKSLGRQSAIVIYDDMHDFVKRLYEKECQQ